MGSCSAQVAHVFPHDPVGAIFPELGSLDPELGRLMAALPGLRPVCFTSPYEAAAWAIISTRVGTAQAAAVQDRLAVEHGHRIHVAGADVHVFPEPERLLRVGSAAGLSDEKVARLHG